MISELFGKYESGAKQCGNTRDDWRSAPVK